MQTRSGKSTPIFAVYTAVLLSIQIDMRKRFRGNQAAVMVSDAARNPAVRCLFDLAYALQGKELQEKRQGGDIGGL